MYGELSTADGIIMKKGILCVLMVMAVSLLGGCGLAYQSNAEKALATAKTEDFGVLPDNYKEQIKDLMAIHLKDPDSAKYTNWEEPHTSTIPSENLLGGDTKPILVWKVYTLINAKNSFGGYSGNTKYEFSFVNGKIYAFGEYGKRIQYVNN